MNKIHVSELYYFPGCSLAASALENKVSMEHIFEHLGFNLIELEDWNCCGSSSAHSINTTLAHDLATRNLSLAPEGKPLLVACPSCFLRLRGAQASLSSDQKAREAYEKKWNRKFDPDLKILHFFEFLDEKIISAFSTKRPKNLDGLRFVPYYGYMLAKPPVVRSGKMHHGIMERILSNYGATPLTWSHLNRCCGTYLTVARPDIVTPMVQDIIHTAIASHADCIITACAMCQMNLEIRCTPKNQIPIMHFSEVLAMGLGLGEEEYLGWFSRHLINPKPVFQAIGILK